MGILNYEKNDLKTKLAGADEVERVKNLAKYNASKSKPLLKGSKVNSKSRDKNK